MLSLEQIIQKIKKAGGRITKVRQGVIAILLVADRPIDAAELAKRLKKKKITADRTTIYREVLYLLHNSIIHRVQLNDGAQYYEILDEHHHHLVCTSCHSIVDMILHNDLEEQAKKIWKKEKFKVTDHTLEFFGLCAKCV
ncbi:MAG: transcriptional repressor [bacterium]|nr:transcriptional repressor [bacterium]